MNADEHRLTEAALSALSERINVQQQEPITVYNHFFLARS
jgi:hypothetical protein